MQCGGYLHPCNTQAASLIFRMQAALANGSMPLHLVKCFLQILRLLGIVDASTPQLIQTPRPVTCRTSRGIPLGFDGA